MSQRKPPEFILYEADLQGYTSKGKPGMLRAQVRFEARDIDAAVELLVEKHREFSRTQANDGRFWHDKNGNPDVFFRIEPSKLENLTRGY